MPRILILVVAITGALMVGGCRRADPASQIATQAATAEQAKRWEDVGRRGSPAGLRRLAPQRPAVEPRQQSRGPSRVIPPGAGSLAPGVVTGIRLVSTTQTGDWEYSGSAMVLRVADDGVELGFGANARLTFVARLNGARLRVAVGDRVDLAVSSSNADIFQRQEILAVRIPNGTELIAALKTGPERVVLTVTLPRMGPLPPLTLVASQTGTPANGSMPVTVETSTAKEDVRAGTVRQIDGLFVSLLSSIAQPEAGTATDVGPYAIDLTVWRLGR